MQVNRTIGAMSSIGLHTVVLGSFLVHGCQVTKPPEQLAAIAFLPADAAMHIEEIGDNWMLQCKNPYVGVGFMYERGTGLINDVPESYPAYKSGIRAGDYLVDEYRAATQGGYWEGEINHLGRTTKYRIKATTICTSTRK
jgi:hypothetical protein